MITLELRYCLDFIYLTEQNTSHRFSVIAVRWDVFAYMIFVYSDISLLCYFERETPKEGTKINPAKTCIFPSLWVSLSHNNHHLKQSLIAGIPPVQRYCCSMGCIFCIILSHYNPDISKFISICKFMYFHLLFAGNFVENMVLSSN